MFKCVFFNIIIIKKIIKIPSFVSYLGCGDGDGYIHEVTVDDLLSVDDCVHRRLLLKGVRTRLNKNINQSKIEA